MGSEKNESDSVFSFPRVYVKHFRSKTSFMSFVLNYNNTPPTPHPPPKKNPNPQS